MLSYLNTRLIQIFLLINFFVSLISFFIKNFAPMFFGITFYAQLQVLKVNTD
jgi:hypothetical protein